MLCLFLVFKKATQNHKHSVSCFYRGPSQISSAVDDPSVSQTVFTITEKAPTWLKAPTSTFTFKTLLRHYAKRVLTPRSLNVKLGLRHKSQKGRAGWLA